MDLARLLVWIQTEFGLEVRHLQDLTNDVCGRRGVSHVAVELCEQVKDSFVRDWPSLRNRAASRTELQLCFVQRANDRLKNWFRSPRSRTRSVPHEYLIRHAASDNDFPWDEFEQALRASLKGHPDAELMICCVLLTWRDNLTEAEVARRVGIPENECSLLVNRALAILKRHLRREGR